MSGMKSYQTEPATKRLNEQKKNLNILLEMEFRADQELLLFYDEVEMKIMRKCVCVCVSWAVVFVLWWSTFN